MAEIVSQQSDRIWLLTVLYVGPDLLLPITSALAAFAGVALLFWQRLVGFVRKVINLMQRKG